MYKYINGLKDAIESTHFFFLSHVVLVWWGNATCLLGSFDLFIAIFLLLHIINDVYI